MRSGHEKNRYFERGLETSGFDDVVFLPRSQTRDTSKAVEQWSMHIQCDAIGLRKGGGAVILRVISQLAMLAPLRFEAIS